jgi:hypothetical protein
VSAPGSGQWRARERLLAAMEEECPDCTCCTWGGCHRGPDSDCPVGGEGSMFEAMYLCPCTEE